MRREALLGAMSGSDAALRRAAFISASEDWYRRVLLCKRLRRILVEMRYDRERVVSDACWNMHGYRNGINVPDA